MNARDKYAADGKAAAQQRFEARNKALIARRTRENAVVAKITRQWVEESPEDSFEAYLFSVFRRHVTFRRDLDGVRP